MSDIIRQKNSFEIGSQGAAHTRSVLNDDRRDVKLQRQITRRLATQRTTNSITLNNVYASIDETVV